MASGKIKTIDKADTRAYGSYLNPEGWILKKRGNIVFCFMTTLTSAPAGAFNSPNAIPEAFRPKPFANKTMVPRTGAARAPIAVSFNEDGSIGFYNYGEALTGTTSINDTIAWPTD